MRLKLVSAVFCVAAFVIPASAQVSVYVKVGPPPIRYEEPPPPPEPEYCWVEGYWVPVGHHHYRWVAGHWERPPYPGTYWVHPHYDHYEQGWRFHEGHWDQEDHDRDRDHEHDHGRGHHDHGEHDDQ